MSQVSHFSAHSIPGNWEQSHACRLGCCACLQILQAARRAAVTRAEGSPVPTTDQLIPIPPCRAEPVGMFSILLLSGPARSFSESVSRAVVGLLIGSERCKPASPPQFRGESHSAGLADLSITRRNMRESGQRNVNIVSTSKAAKAAGE